MIYILCNRIAIIVLFKTMYIESDIEYFAMISSNSKYFAYFFKMIHSNFLTFLFFYSLHHFCCLKTKVLNDE